MNTVLQVFSAIMLTALLGAVVVIITDLCLRGREGPDASVKVVDSKGAPLAVRTSLAAVNAPNSRLETPRSTHPGRRNAVLLLQALKKVPGAQDFTGDAAGSAAMGHAAGGQVPGRSRGRAGALPRPYPSAATVGSAAAEGGAEGTAAEADVALLGLLRARGSGQEETVVASPRRERAAAPAEQSEESSSARPILPEAGVEDEEVTLVVDRTGLAREDSDQRDTWDDEMAVEVTLVWETGSELGTAS